VTKETRNDHLKIVVGKPVVHRTTTYVQQPQPVIVSAPVVQYRKTARYVDATPEYTSSGSDYSGCEGPCGGSKIVKIIKKTTYRSGGGGDGE